MDKKQVMPLPELINNVVKFVRRDYGGVDTVTAVTNKFEEFVQSDVTLRDVFGSLDENTRQNVVMAAAVFADDLAEAQLKSSRERQEPYFDEIRRRVSSPGSVESLSFRLTQAESLFQEILGRLDRVERANGDMQVLFARVPQGNICMGMVIDARDKGEILELTHWENEFVDSFSSGSMSIENMSHKQAAIARRIYCEKVIPYGVDRPYTPSH